MRKLLICLLVLAGCATQTVNVHDDIEVSRSGGEPPVEDVIAVDDQQYRPASVNSRGFREFIRVRDDARVVLIPGGRYHTRGQRDVPGTEMKQPRDWRYLPPMLYDKFEVTNRQVAAFLNQEVGVKFSAGKVSATDGKPWATDHRWGLRITAEGVSVQDGFENHPAVGTSGWLALAYSKWVGGKLPNAGEFDKAAGGPSGLLFPWGNEDKLPDSTRCNSYLHGPRMTTPVGSYPDGASPYGLLDMSGNVYERAYWAELPSADPDLNKRNPTMIKGGAWVSPNWSNLRSVDICAQRMDHMEGSVGFRVCVSDADVLKQFVVAKPKLRTFTNTLEAYNEAADRNVPILLYLGYERCGQCDRVQAQLFTDPEFIEYANENLVVLIGHEIREYNDMPKTPVTDDGIFFVNTVAPLEELREVWFDFSIWRPVQHVPLPDSLCVFKISPGLALLNPYRKQVSYAPDAVLIGDETFHGHKGGGELDLFLGWFGEAQAKLGRGLTLAEYEAKADTPETIWKPTPEDQAMWDKARADMIEVGKALNQHAMENDGSYPKTLDEIRSYFKNWWLPQDPFSGDYFRYEQTDEGFELTCYGTDDAIGGEGLNKDIEVNQDGLVE